MPGIPLGFFPLDPAETVKALEVREGGGVDIVQKIVIKIAHPGFSKLFLKNPISVIKRVQDISRQLICQLIAVTRVAFHERCPDCALALFPTVRPGCVKIGESAGKIGVHHLLEQFEIDAPSVVGICQGQPHRAKTEFFHIVHLWGRGLFESGAA